jgi:aldehyde:ferredoxin oxidoreductase
MSPERRYYNGSVGLVDLAARSFRVVPLDGEAVREHLGGAALNGHLYRMFRETDPLVLGTGPLTGSFAPASCLLVATFRPPGDSQGPVHVPLTLRTGPEMKFSRFDFLVLQGKADFPTLLRVREGTVQFAGGGDLLGKNLREAAPLMANNEGSCAWILAGRAGGRGIPGAAVQTGTAGSFDRSGLALSMGERNLEAVLFQGTDGLAFPSDHAGLSLELARRIRAREGKPEGFRSALRRLGLQGDDRKIFRGAEEKIMACYHCPFPCMTHVRYPVRRFASGRGKKDRDALWLADPWGFAALREKRPGDVLPLLGACREFGLDPLSAASLLTGDEPFSEALVKLENLLSGEAGASLSPAPPSGRGRIWSGILPPGDGMPPSREEKLSAAMVLGICPMFLLVAPSVEPTDLLGFLPEKDGGGGSYGDRVREIAKKLVTGATVP